MSSEIKQGQAINTAISFIEETKQKLDNINSRTVSEAQAAGSSGWKGAGGNSFQELMTKYNDKAREITKALDQLTQGLANARRLGSDADQDIASQSKSVAGQVEGHTFKF